MSQQRDAHALSEYEAISRQEGNHPVQINANLLQLENEFYSTIRPKRNVPSGTKPLDGLTAKALSMSRFGRLILIRSTARN